MEKSANPSRRSSYHVPHSVEALRESRLVSPEEVERISGELDSRIEPAFLNNVSRPLKGWALVRHANGDHNLHNVSFDSAIDTLNRELICELLSDQAYEALAGSYQAQQCFKHEKAIFEKARKIDMSEWKGPVFLGDRYHPDVEDLIDWVVSSHQAGDQLPEYAYGATKVEPLSALSAETLIDDLQDQVSSVEGMEDWDFSGLEQLQKAVDAFAEANSDCVYYEADTSVAVMLDWSGVEFERSAW